MSAIRSPRFTRSPDLTRIFEAWAYLVVTPYPWLVDVFVLEGDSYRVHKAYSKNDRFKSPTFPELQVDLEKVFDFPIPPEQRIEMVKEGRPEYGRQ